MIGITPKQAARFAYQFQIFLLEKDKDINREIPKNLMQCLLEDRPGLKELFDRFADSIDDSGTRYTGDTVADRKGTWEIYLKPLLVHYDLPIQDLKRSISAGPEQELFFPSDPGTRNREVKDLLLMRVIPVDCPMDLKGIQTQVILSELKPAGIWELAAIRRHYRELYNAGVESVLATADETLCVDNNDVRVPELHIRNKGKEVEIYFESEEAGYWSTETFCLFTL